MWFDIVCIIIIVAGFAFGYRRGFFAQAGSVFGVLAGVLFCNLFSERLAEHFIEPGDDAATVMLSTVMSYVIVFLGCYVGGRVIGSALRSLFKAIHLGPLDRLAGAVFTMFEYALVFSMLLNAWVGAFPDTKLRTQYSDVKEFVLNLAPNVFGSSTVREIFGSVKNVSEKAGPEVEGGQPNGA